MFRAPRNSFSGLVFGLQEKEAKLFKIMLDFDYSTCGDVKLL